MEVSFRWCSFSIFSIRGIFRFLPLIFHGVLFSGLGWPRTNLPGPIFQLLGAFQMVPEKNQGVFYGTGNPWRFTVMIFHPLLEGPGEPGRFRSPMRDPKNGTEPREGRGMEELQSGWIFIQRQHQRLSPWQRIPGPHFCWGWWVFTLKVQNKKIRFGKTFQNIIFAEIDGCFCFWLKKMWCFWSLFVWGEKGHQWAKALHFLGPAPWQNEIGVSISNSS